MYAYEKNPMLPRATSFSFVHTETNKLKSCFKIDDRTQHGCITREIKAYGGFVPAP